MRPILFLCAEGVSIDRQSNNVTVYNVIEEIASVGFPLLIPKLFLLASLAKEEGDSDTIPLTIRISSGENEVFNQTTTVDFQGKPRTRLIVQLQGTTVPAAGTLRFEILSEGRQLSEYLIDVKGVAKPKMKVVEAEPDAAQDGESAGAPSSPVS